MLLGVLPDKEGPTDVDIEGADDSKLRYLHAVIQHVDQVNGNAFAFITAHIQNKMHPWQRSHNKIHNARNTEHQQNMDRIYGAAVRFILAKWISFPAAWKKEKSCFEVAITRIW